MADSKTIVHRGERVSIEMPEENAASTASPEQARRAVMFPPDETDDLYVFRQEWITFYDLGTRKNEDGSYRDIMPAHLVSPYSLYDYYHSTLLQGDFTMSCLRIPQKAQYLYFDVQFLPSDPDLDMVDGGLELIGEKDTRPFVREIGFQSGSTSPSNVNHTLWSRASLPLRSPKDDEGEKVDVYLSVESAFYYNAFYTGSPRPVASHFKITTTPDQAASGIFFAIKEHDKVFLTPILATWSTGTTPNHYYIARRLPVLPGFSPQRTPLTLLGYDPSSNELRARASVELWDAIDAYYSPIFGSVGWSRSRPSIPVGFAGASETTIDDLVGGDAGAHSWLVAVIVRGTEKFYVWQNYVVSLSDGSYIHRRLWGTTRIYKPG